MTTIENLLRIQIFSRSVLTCLKYQPSKTISFYKVLEVMVFNCLKWQPPKTMALTTLKPILVFTCLK